MDEEAAAKSASATAQAMHGPLALAAQNNAMVVLRVLANKTGRRPHWQAACTPKTSQHHEVQQVKVTACAFVLR